MALGYPDPSVDSILSLETVAPYYDAVLELAEERLDGPIQTHLRTWEDGEFKIRVYHGYGPHPQRPRTSYFHILQYHSERGLTTGMEVVDIDTDDRALVYKRDLDSAGILPDNKRIRTANRK